jgi:methyl-accepting chemotaxis protein
MFGMNVKSARNSDKLTALEAMFANVMLADADLKITYMNRPLEALMREAEPELKKELPRFSVATLIGSNIDIFHKNAAHQRNMLAKLEKRHDATIWIGKRAFDLRVMPLRRGKKRAGFVVEWADATARLLNLDYAAKIAGISRSQAMIEFTPSGVITEANEKFLKVVGYSLEEIQGKSHGMLVDASFRETAEYAEFWKSLGRGEIQAGEFRRIGKSGKELWIQGSYNPILGPDGKVSKVIKFATDITGRVKAVNQIADGLKQLADGDLKQRIETAFIPELDRLRVDFNSSLETLEKSMIAIHANVEAIRNGAGEIGAATDDLSRRTEQQASSLEETAAALDEITSTVKKAAEGATHARDVVASARSDADKSGEIVRKATESMTGIEQSSKQIGQIIGVIDEIAFQTNLLALNAGVEAARAGEAGRGFAVVASEVRALAQRSAEAAKEIKGLIVTSTAQVDQGVKLVTEAGGALERIMTQVVDISNIINDIAAGAQQQASGLQEVNIAVNQMDQVTQQNAAMVEETSASTHTLSQESEELGRLIGRFQVKQTGDNALRRAVKKAAPHAFREAPSKPQTTKRPMIKAVANGSRSSAADSANWNEF